MKRYRILAEERRKENARVDDDKAVTHVRKNEEYTRNCRKNDSNIYTGTWHPHRFTYGFGAKMGGTTVFMATWAPSGGTRAYIPGGIIPGIPWWGAACIIGGAACIIGGTACIIGGAARIIGGATCIIPDA